MSRRPVPNAKREDAKGMGWPEFEERLAKALDTMRPETFLILTTPTVAGEATYYVQFAHATDELRVEAVTSHHLPPGKPLLPEQEARIRELGWTEPDADGPGRNAYRDWAVPAPAPEVARLAVETLRSVYGIAQPADLRYRYEAFERPRPKRPALGIEEEPRSGLSTTAGRGLKAARELRALVEAALAAWLGAPRVQPDQDGDYPFRAGSALCYVRLMGGLPPTVSVFSLILRDVTLTPLLLAALDRINGRIRYGRVFTSGRTVVVRLDLPAIDLAPAHVQFACQELGALADHLDDVLHGRFGSPLWFDPSPKLLN